MIENDMLHNDLNNYAIYLKKDFHNRKMICFPMKDDSMVKDLVLMSLSKVLL